MAFWQPGGLLLELLRQGTVSDGRDPPAAEAVTAVQTGREIGQHCADRVLGGVSETWSGQ